MKHLKSFKNIAENNNKVSQADAKRFVEEYLKLGTRQNLFHKYLKKNNYDELEVSDLIQLVILELNKYT